MEQGDRTCRRRPPSGLQFGADNCFSKGEKELKGTSGKGGSRALEKERSIEKRGRAGDKRGNGKERRKGEGRGSAARLGEAAGGTGSWPGRRAKTQRRLRLLPDAHWAVKPSKAQRQKYTETSNPSQLQKYFSIHLQPMESRFDG